MRWRHLSEGREATWIPGEAMPPPTWCLPNPGPVTPMCCPDTAAEAPVGVGSSCVEQEPWDPQDLMILLAGWAW